MSSPQGNRMNMQFHKSVNFYKQELAWWDLATQARATKQQARINRFHDFKKEVSDTSAGNRLEHEFWTSCIGKGHRVCWCFHLLWRQTDSDLTFVCQRPYQNRRGQRVKSTRPTSLQEVSSQRAGRYRWNGSHCLFFSTIEGLDESKGYHHLQEVAEEVSTMVVLLHPLQNY